jgi:hypothetical protein
VDLQHPTPVQAIILGIGPPPGPGNGPSHFQHVAAYISIVNGTPPLHKPNFAAIMLIDNLCKILIIVQPEGGQLVAVKEIGPTNLNSHWPVHVLYLYSNCTVAVTPGHTSGNVHGNGPIHGTDGQSLGHGGGWDSPKETIDIKIKNEIKIVFFI